MRRFASRGLARRLLSSSSASASPPPGATAIPPLPSTAAPPVVVPFSEVAVAKHRVAAGVPSSSEPKGAANPGGVVRTPCTKNTQLSAMLGCELYLKKEHQQRTGSFKDRGACNALRKLVESDVPLPGAIAASAGNHALAMAYNGRALGIPITVVMPTVAPLTKVQRCRDFGATVIIHGQHILESYEHALTLVESDGLTYINGFDDPDIIAGQGTIGLEILDDHPDVDAIVIPVGGGGLIAGVALAAKTLKPSVQIIGVEPRNCASWQAALKAGAPTRISMSKAGTLADGLAVPEVGRNAFATCAAHDLVDEIVTVDEHAIALSILRLVEIEQAIVEGGGAAGLAALLDGGVSGSKGGSALAKKLAGKKVVAILCGGNIDTPVLGRVINRGLAADGRLARFVVEVSDRPGSVAGLTKVIADIGANLLDMSHQRAWVHNNIHATQIQCIVETRSQEHTLELEAAISADGFDIMEFGNGNGSEGEHVSVHQGFPGSS